MGSIQVKSERRALKDLHNNLRKVNRKDLQADLRNGLSESAKPAARTSTAMVRKVQVSSSKGGEGSKRSPNTRPLRRHISRNMQVSVRQAGVRIRVRPSAFSKDEHSLPKYLDAELKDYKRWTHPIFGDPEKWAEQRGENWFFVSMRMHFEEFRKSAAEVIHDVSNQLRK